VAAVGNNISAMHKPISVWGVCGVEKDGIFALSIVFNAAHARATL